MSKKPLGALGTYQGDISNLRSHHWKYWLDLYSNCYYDCAYCPYRASGPMGKVSAHPERIETMRRDLEGLKARGILYLGPKADVYQPLEKKMQLMRAALAVCLETRTPTFIVTRSELIRRDFDLLAQLAQLGLVEVSVTIASSKVLDAVEPHTPTPEQRLELVHDLKAHGIATSVHLSPILPHVDDLDDLKGLLDQVAAAGADCSYACVLGMSSAYYRTFATAIERWDDRRALRVLAEYPREIAGDGMHSASDGFILDLMTSLSRHATQRGIPFACVHIPPLDTAERNGGIFRYKLPTVGDIIRHLSRTGQREVALDDLLGHVGEFQSVDSDYLESVTAFWRGGQLFKNTYFHPVVEGGAVSRYVLKDVLDVGITNMVVG
jgi:DNA repair photolyase